jgi:hypothetical protein
MLRMIHLMVHGNERDPSRTRYGLFDAAHAVGYHRRAARALAMSPLFYEAHQRELDGRGNAGVVPTLEEIRREIELRQRKKTDRPTAEAIAAAAQPAPLALGYVIRLDTAEPEDEA